MVSLPRLGLSVASGCSNNTPIATDPYGNATRPSAWHNQTYGPGILATAKMQVCIPDAAELLPDCRRQCAGSVAHGQPFDRQGGLSVVAGEPRRLAGAG